MSENDMKEGRDFENDFHALDESDILPDFDAINNELLSAGIESGGDAVPLPEIAELSEADAAVDEILAPFEPPQQEVSWLDNLLKFAQSGEATMTSDVPAVPAPVEAAADGDAAAGDSLPEEANGSEAGETTVEPEEINPEDWQETFPMAEGGEGGPTLDANAAETLELTEAVPIVMPQGTFPDSADEAKGLASPDGKNDQQFKIESDYKHDFGEYDRIHPIKVNRKHRTGCVGGILYFFFILVTGALLAGMLWLGAMDVLAINKPNEEIEVTVPDGFTIDEVTDTLKDNGLINYKFLFKIFASLSHAENKIESGVYHLKTSYDYRALVSAMSSSSGARIEVKVTVPEGYNLFQMFELLEEQGVCTQDKLWEAAANAEFDYDFLDPETLGDRYRLEGFLFPDTYNFYMNDNPVRVINKFLSNFNSKFTEEYRLRCEELGYTPRQMLSIAAMVEKEAGHDSEQPTVASVIYNRLNSDDYPYLQIDATVYYAAAITGEEFSTGIDNPYNTYAYRGLPNPITNPGITAIKAALYPETTNYYFYAATVNGDTRFFTRYDDFVAFVQSDEFQGG